MNPIERMRSQYDDGMSDEESFSENEGGRKSAELKSKQSTTINKNSEDYRKRRQRNNEGKYEYDSNFNSKIILIQN